MNARDKLTNIYGPSSEDLRTDLDATVGINQWRHEYDGVQAPEASVSQHYDKVPDPVAGCHWCACGNRWPCKHAGEVAS